MSMVGSWVREFRKRRNSNSLSQGPEGGGRTQPIRHRRLLHEPLEDRRLLTTISDGDFAAWTYESLAAPGSSATATLVASEGNPDAHIKMTTDTGQAAFAVALNGTPSWTPATDGPIDSVQMALDVKSVSGWGTGQHLELLVEQSGQLYAAPGSNFFTGSSTSWHTVAMPAYSAQSFKKVIGYDYTNWDDTVHPDFSSQGSELKFGFAAGNSNSWTYTQLYDNWTLDVTAAVPMPPHVTSVSPAPGSTVDDALSAIAVTFDAPVAPSTVSAQTVCLTASGGDGTFGEANDETIAGQVSYDTATSQATITVDTPLAPDTYQLSVSDAVLATDGLALDGEWPGSEPGFPSGDGTAGGGFVCTFQVMESSPTDYDPLVIGVDGITAGPGMLPGPLENLGGALAIAFGDGDTEPLVQQQPPTVVGAASLGDGRGVFFGHKDFLTSPNNTLLDNDVFIANVASWLGQGGKRILFDQYSYDYWGLPVHNGLVDLLSPAGYTFTVATGDLTASQLSEADILVVATRWTPFTSAELAAVEDFTRAGGGVLATGLGWSWLSDEVGNTLDNFPMNDLAGMFGLCYVDGAISDPTDNLGDPSEPIFHRFYSGGTSPDQLIVSTLTDELDGDHSDGDLSLREALDLAAQQSGDDVITFKDSLSGGTIALSSTLGQLVIDSNVDIQGLGAEQLTIDAGQHSRVFDTASGIAATISGLTIAGGEAGMDQDTGRGGGLRVVAGTEVTLDSMIVTGNHAFKGGGAYNAGTLTVRNTTISNNSAVDGGGLLNDHTLDMRHAILADNSAAADGGGIYNFGTADLFEVAVLRNQAEAGGGGIMNELDGQLSAAQCTVADNSAGGPGGGIYVGNPNVADNTVTLTDITVSGNTASYAGGGLYNSSGYVTIRRGTFFGNEAEYTGGGIWNHFALNMANCTISGNTAGDGGGVYQQGALPLALTNVTITANQASTSGGGIWTAAEPPVLHNTIVAGNFLGSDSAPSDVEGDFSAASSHNLIGAVDGSTGLAGNGSLTGTADNPLDPQLLPLADNGGLTLTHALLPQSPAVDAGSDGRATDAGLTTDQRGTGFPRFIDGNTDAAATVDIGAYEANFATNGEIHGTVWHDLNGDGTIDTGEPPLDGWTVFLDTNGNEQVDPTELSTTTASDGSYHFLHLATPNTYTVTELLPEGWALTHPLPAKTYTVPLAPGQVVDGARFGNKESVPGELTGTVLFRDREGNLLSERSIIPTSITVTIWADQPDGLYEWNPDAALWTDQFFNPKCRDQISFSIPPEEVEDGTYVMDVSVFGGDHKRMRFEVSNGESNIDTVLTYEDVRMEGGGASSSSFTYKFARDSWCNAAGQLADDAEFAEEKAAIRAALDTWENSSCVTFVETDQLIPDFWFVKSHPSDNWLMGGADARTIRGGTLLGTKVYFAYDASWTVAKELQVSLGFWEPAHEPLQELLSLESGALHEIGHVLGLNYAPTNGAEGNYPDTSYGRQWSIMTYTSAGYVPWLGWSDVASLKKVYDKSCIVTTTCPVDIVLTDSLGNVVSKSLTQIPDGTYIETDLDGDGEPDDRITIPDPTSQTYSISVIPEPDADPDAPVTLVLENHGVKQILLDEVRVGDLPTEPFLVSVDRTSPQLTADPTPALLSAVDTWISVQIDLQVQDETDPAPRVALVSIQPSWDVDPETVIRGADYGQDDREFELLAPLGNEERYFEVVYAAVDETGNVSHVTTSITALQDLGPIDQKTIPNLEPDSEDFWYAFSTVRDGILTVEAIPTPGASEVEVALFDANSQLLATSQIQGESHRIDWQASGETAYLVRLSGQGNIDLRLTNLVAQDGANISVYGTATDDVFLFSPTSSYSITINEVTYDFDETELGAANLTTITAHGGGGYDSAFMYDSPGDDEFLCRKGYAKLSGDGFLLETFEFMTNYGYATTADGGNDVAYMEDAPENDKFKFDWPKSGQFFGKMYGGGIYYNRAKNFEQIVANMTDGKNRVRLFDSEEDDTFYGQKNEGRLVGNGFDVTVTGYDTLAAYASTGLDVAYLEDSEDDDTTRARPHKITLWGGDDAEPTYEIMARQFDEYHFEGKHGGYDRAKLHDTAFSDHVDARNSSTSLYRNDGELELLYNVVAFEWVKLYATDNDSHDTIEKEDPLDFDLVYDPTMWEEMP